MTTTLARILRPLLVLALALALAACRDGAEKALEQTAKALEEHDSAAFLAQVDMTAMAANELSNLEESNGIIQGLDVLGNILGLGSRVGDVLRESVDMENRLTRSFRRTVGSGELVNQCRRAQTPDCPWVPESLRAAQVKKLDEQAAIARVTTPAGLTSWIALRRQGEAWRVVGKAVLEETAAAYARGEEKPQAKGGPIDARPSTGDTKL